jgi:hypothetical protein
LRPRLRRQTTTFTPRARPDFTHGGPKLIRRGRSRARRSRLILIAERSLNTLKRVDRASALKPVLLQMTSQHEAMDRFRNVVIHG